MPVFAQRVIPVTTTKARVNADDLENPKLPTCDRKYWITDDKEIREMTAEEKVGYYPTNATLQEQINTVLQQIANTDYMMARAVEELADNNLSDEAKANIALRKDLRVQLAALKAQL